ncbi:MAG: hypothetical protein AAB657_00915 [Patescibacteria group bacterium]
MRIFWLIIFFLSIALAVLLLCLPIELLCGVDMPFVTVDDNQFIYLGFNIPPDSQWGVVMVVVMLLMLPERLIHLSLIKLFQKK